MRKMIVLVGLCVLTSCVWAENPEDAKAVVCPEGWQMMDADNKFRLCLPDDMKDVKVQAKDSYAKQFASVRMTMSFDYGWYSDPLKDSAQKGFSEQTLTIGGRRARMVSFERGHAEGNNKPYVIAVHFPDVGVKDVTLTISVFCQSPDDYETARILFQSVRFPVGKK